MYPLSLCQVVFVLLLLLVLVIGQIGVIGLIRHWWGRAQPPFHLFTLSPFQFSTLNHNYILSFSFLKKKMMGMICRGKVDKLWSESLAFTM